MHKKINSICLFSRFTRHDTMPIIHKVISICKDFDIKIYLEKNTPLRESLDLPTCSLNNTQVDYIIVVGGDGSMLQAAQQSSLNIPLLGINTGKLGFLTDICPSELEASLPEIFQGNQFTETRQCLDWKTSYQSGFAINEVCIKSYQHFSVAQFDLLIDDEIIYHQVSDGLIISTPTGSTAYSLSSGGSIVSPQLPCWLITPVCAHRLNTRPLIISDQQKISIQPTHKPISLSADGIHLLDLSIDDKLHLSKNPKKLQLAHPKSYHYYRSLKNKLNWENHNANRY